MPGRPLLVPWLLCVGLAVARPAAGIDRETLLTSVEFSDRGDRRFRAAQFEEAEAAYLEAIELDRTNIRGQLGAARIAAMASDRQRAGRYYSAAYQLNPLDPDAILGYANTIEDARSRRTLLENFLSVGRDARAEDVKARIRIADAFGAGAAIVESSPGNYRIPLEISGATVPMLRASINGARQLRLIVDTGATGVTLNATPASKLGLEYVSDAMITGFGSAAPAPARIMRARNFETGGLKMSNVPLEVAQSDLIPGADGVVGPDLFHNFLVRLNFPGNKLELARIDSSNSGRPGDAAVCAGCYRAWRLDHLLLVRAAIDGRGQGYFIIDSGSRCTLLSRKLAMQDGVAAALEGTQGRQKVFMEPRPITVRLGEQAAMETDYATFDNSELSSSYATEISGALGYSFLRRFTLMLDYRAGVVKFERP